MKILVVRFSSIGDIVLTTPVVRCLAEQIEQSEIHYLTKVQYAGLLEPNPHIHTVHTLNDDFSQTVQALKKEQFDHIIDLHNNLRTHRLSLLLKVPYKRVDKENGKKLRMVYLKDRTLENRHIVERYLQTSSSLGVVNDGKGLEYHYPDSFSFNLSKLRESHRKQFVCIAIGGQHFTKKLPLNHLIRVCQKLHGPVIILGGPEDQPEGDILEKKCENVQNMAGHTDLNESTWLVEHCHALMTHDTGMMHIGAAFHKTIYSIWGNTVPEFGMTPYKPGAQSEMFEVKDLKCRPCSKIGYDHCPKTHFKCMNDQEIDLLIDRLNG